MRRGQLAYRTGPSVFSQLTSIRRILRDLTSLTKTTNLALCRINVENVENMEAKTDVFPLVFVPHGQEVGVVLLTHLEAFREP